MFFVFNLRKLRVPTALVLLFVLLTAIIMLRYEPAAQSVWLPDEAEPVLVIDAGHGGLDGGAAAEDGMTESGVNLAIAQRLELLARLLGVKTVMTRESEELDYPDEAATVAAKKTWDQKTRVELINSVPGAVLVSIHQNRYPDPRPSGAQVLYAKTDGSEALGKAMHELLCSSLCPENRRVAAPIADNIYLMRSVSCPAVLVECGFLSNPTEAQLLSTDAYRTKLAMTMLTAFLQFVA